VSESIAHVENPADSNATRPVPRFTLLGFIVGLLLGGVSGVAEFLIRRRNLDDVAWPIYVFLYPLVGLGLGWLLDKYPHARRWVRPHDFFSTAPTSQKEDEVRDCRVRRFVGIGFGVGIVVAILAAVLDVPWRGWPFLNGTLIGGLLFCPSMGVLIGYKLSLRPGDSKPSIRNFRFRTRTLMGLVAYVAVLCGLGSQVGRYSSLAMLYHSRALNARSMVDVFQDLAEKNRVNLMRADNAKDLRAGRIPDGISASQKMFLKELEGKATGQYKQYRYGLIADGEDLQAKLASQNSDQFTKLVQHYNQLAEKYTKAAKQPSMPVNPDPPLP
jgi:hypothetical protein